MFMDLFGSVRGLRPIMVNVHFLSDMVSALEGWLASPDIIMIIHLLGLAPAGYVAAPDKRAGARLGQAPEHASHHPSDRASPDNRG
jgi:hypothetical protein